MPDSPLRARSPFLVRWYPVLVYVAVVVGLAIWGAGVADGNGVSSGPEDSVVQLSRVRWLFVGLLFCWFAYAAWWYRVPRLEGANALRVSAHHRHGDEAASAALASKFAVHRSLRPQWEAFLRARNPNRPGDAHAAAGLPSTVSPADFITIESVLGRHYSKLPHALPGIFAALGLLGTFVGIAIALSEIDMGPLALESSGEPENDEFGQRLEDINQLMAGMSTAFLTSIVGIAQSVWWLIEFRWADRRLESAHAGFIRRAEDAFPVEQPHDTLFRIASSGAALEGVGETAGRIKGEIQQLGQDLASAFENHLKTYVSDPLRELNTELGHRQQQALNRMVESFQDSLISSVGDQIDAFGDALRSATDHQVRTAKALDRFFDRLEQVADTQTTLLRRTSEVAGVFESGLTRLVEAKEAIAEASRLAQETMDAARKLSLECQRQLEAPRAGNGGSRAVVGRAAGFHETSAP